MLFFKGKEDMGLEASLKLLDLPPDATIDDANQAYAYLHRMIDLFHQDTDAGKRGDRQEDMELLTCAYERAVAYLSDRGDGDASESTTGPPDTAEAEASESTDLHFTINFNADAIKDTPPVSAPAIPEPNNRIVQEAVSITTRRLHEAESGMPLAQQAVEAAAAAVESANRQHEAAKLASMDAVVAAKSAKSRALLLEIEAKRTMADAIAVAEKARDRVVAARQAAKNATLEVDKAREAVRRVRQSEETAAAEAICAEDRLEKEKSRLQALSHTLIAARERMRMFEEPAAADDMQRPPSRVPSSDAISADRHNAAPAADEDAAARQQILSDLLDIEASFNARKRAPVPAADNNAPLSDGYDPASEKRQYPRLVYPLDRRPSFSIDGRSIPILDLSTAGMRLESNDDMTHPRIVRGAIAFAGQRPLPITGKVVRGDDQGLGLRLVTRIGNHILDQERLSLSA